MRPLASLCQCQLSSGISFALSSVSISLNLVFSELLTSAVSKNLYCAHALLATVLFRSIVMLEGCCVVKIVDFELLDTAV